MKKSPRISFIVPAYNIETYLAACLDSLLALSVAKEIIVVNDGSTDNTAAIMQDYADRYAEIKTVTQANQGVSGARNAGLSQASGDWLLFVDGDDVMINDSDLNVLLDYAESNQLDLLKGLYLLSIPDVPPMVKQPVLAAVAQGQKAIISSLDFAEQAFGTHYFAHIGCYFIRRTTLKRLNLAFVSPMPMCEDMLFVYQLLSSNVKMAEVPFVFYHYQKRENSLSTAPISIEKTNGKAYFLDYLQAISVHYPPTRHFDYVRDKLRSIITQNHSVLRSQGVDKALLEQQPYFKWLLTSTQFADYQAKEAALAEQQAGRGYYFNPNAEKNDRTFSALLPKPPEIDISFIVPIYNVEKWLPTCLESILAEKVRKEIILIDDGSTDNSLLIALNYAVRNEEIVLVRSKNEGLSAARNKGIKLARGNYVHFVDADDYLINQNLAELLQQAVENDAQIANMQYRSLLRTSTLLTSEYGLPLVNHRAVDFYPLLLAHNTQMVWKYLIKRSFLEKHQLMFEEGVFAEDVAFSCKLFLSDPNAKVIESDLLCYYYRERDGSLNQTINGRNKMIKGFWATIDILENWLNHQPHQAQIRPLVAQTQAHCRNAAKRYQDKNVQAWLEG